MELNREQIVKALDAFHDRILNSKLAEKVTESEMMAVVDALTLINDLVKELFEAHNKNVELIKENAQLKFFDLVTAQQEAEYFKKQYLEAKHEVLMDFAERLLDTKCKICNDDYIFADNVKVILSKMLTEGGGEQ